MKTNIRFERLSASDAESISTATALYLDAFKNEAVTNFAFRFNQPKGKQFMHQFTTSYLKLAIQNGDQVLVAKDDNKIVAIAIMNLPSQHQRRSNIGDYLRLWKDALPLLAYVKYAHLSRVIPGMAVPKELPKMMNTLQIFAVSTDIQGKGIGRQFLAELKRRFTMPDGLYLTTGIQRSADYYQEAGFRLLETRQYEGLSVYHLYLNEEKV